MARIYSLGTVPGCLKVDLAGLYLRGGPCQWYDLGRVSSRTIPWNQLRLNIERNFTDRFEPSVWEHERLIEVNADTDTEDEAPDDNIGHNNDNIDDGMEEDPKEDPEGDGLNL